MRLKQQPRITDRLGKPDSIYHPLKRKKKMLERFVAHIKKYKTHPQVAEKQRRVRQIDRGVLRPENGLVTA